jgi:hypothetical protein
MALSDDDLVRQLESVPQVEPPDMRLAVMSRIRQSSLPAGERGAKRQGRVLIGLAWAAAIVIVAGIALQRVSLPWEHTAATLAPLPVDQWPVVARVNAPDEGRLTVRRNGDRFAIQPVAYTGESVSVAWDQKKLVMSDVVSDVKGPEVVILQRKEGASGSAVIQLNVGGREVIRTSIAVQ